MKLIEVSLMIDCTKTENYFAEKLKITKRTKKGLCETSCSDCPLYNENNGTSEGLSCGCLEMHYPEKAIEIVQKWSDEHLPKTTYLSELLKHFPKVKLDDIGTPKKLCPHELGLNEIEDCGKTDNCCAKCWNQPLPEKEKVK